MPPFIPFASADLGAEEAAAVAEVLASGWVTTGPKCAELEAAFRAYTGAEHALAVNSCTAAMHLALAAMGIGPGDEVITTPLTFCATVNVILQTGATAVLADISDDLDLDPEHVEATITPRTRAILPVHYGGLPCRMDAIWALAAKHGLKVVEDAAHAAGAEYRGRKIGAGPSDAVCFSFYANKNMTTGEGGMVTTPSSALAERMRVLALHGMSRDAWNRYAERGSWYYEVVECGFKYNLSDIQAAIGLVQLRKLDRMNARRAEIAGRYNEAFATLDELELPPVRSDSKHAWHLYALRLRLEKLEIGRAEFIERMRDRGIGCSVHFIPVPLHPYYRRALELRDPCERALAEYPRLVSLPLHSRLSDEEVERVIAAVREIIAAHRKARPVAVNSVAETGN